MNNNSASLLRYMQTCLATNQLIQSFLDDIKSDMQIHLLNRWKKLIDWMLIQYVVSWEDWK